MAYDMDSTEGSGNALEGCGTEGGSGFAASESEGRSRAITEAVRGAVALGVSKEVKWTGSLEQIARARTQCGFPEKSKYDWRD